MVIRERLEAVRRRVQVLHFKVDDGGRFVYTGGNAVNGFDIEEIGLDWRSRMAAQSRIRVISRAQSVFVAV